MIDLSAMSPCYDKRRELLKKDSCLTSNIGTFQNKTKQNKTKKTGPKNLEQKIWHLNIDAYIH